MVLRLVSFAAADVVDQVVAEGQAAERAARRRRRQVHLPHAPGDALGGFLVVRIGGSVHQQRPVHVAPFGELAPRQ